LIRIIVAAGRTGRKLKIGIHELNKIDIALRKGARANGFATDLWTLRRVAKVIEAITGVHYHQGHVWRILRDSMRWPLQRPAKRAKERNEETVKVWGSQRPPLRRTWALRGETPVVVHSYNWKKISICCGDCLPVGRKENPSVLPDALGKLCH